MVSSALLLAAHPTSLLDAAEGDPPSASMSAPKEARSTGTRPSPAEERTGPLERRLSELERSVAALEERRRASRSEQPPEAGPDGAGYGATVRRIVEGEFRAFNSMLAILSVFVASLGAIVVWAIRRDLDRHLNERVKRIDDDLQAARESFDRIRIRSHVSLQHQMALALWRNSGEFDAGSEMYKEAIVIAMSIAEANYILAKQRFDELRDPGDPVDTLYFLEAHNSYAYYRSLYHQVATAGDGVRLEPLDRNAGMNVIGIAQVPYLAAERNAALPDEERNPHVARQRFNWCETYASTLITFGEAAEQAQGYQILRRLMDDADLPAVVRERIASKHFEQRDGSGPEGP